MRNFILLHLLVYLVISCTDKGYIDKNYVDVKKINISSNIISILAPVDGTYSLGSSLDFQVTFDNEISVIGSPCIKIIIGVTTRSACYQSGSGSQTLSFRYLVQAGELDIDGIEFSDSLIDGSSLSDSTSGRVQLSFSHLNSDLSLVNVDTAIAAADTILSVTQTNLTSDRTQASFSWIEPNDNGSAISRYILRYKKRSETLYTYLTPDPVTNSAVITNLDTESIYDVQIASFNGVIGAYSSNLEVSTYFTPKSLGALIWYEAKDLNADGSSIADGTPFTRISDKSGNGNHADKISGTSATIETQAGYKVMRLDSSGYRTISSLGESANTDVEVYLVSRTRSIVTSYAFVNENEGNANRFGTHFPWTDSVVYIDLPLGSRFSSAWGGNTTDFFAWTFRSSTTQGSALERDGTSIINTGNRALTPALKRWTFGSNYNGSANYWKADVQAVFVFAKVLNAQQRQEFYDFIEREYGVSMP